MNEIISILKKSVFADGYSIYKQIDNAKMADITKTISYLQQEKIIHVRGHRKNHRTGLSIPIYSLRSGHSSIDTTDNSIDRLDMDRFLSCVVSERVVEYRFLVRNLIPSRINMKILDVGSERSAVTNALSKFGNSKNWEVFGIAIVQGLPQPFKDKEISRFVLFNMDARFMGCRNEVFDKIICFSTVEHVGIHPGH